MFYVSRSSPDGRQRICAACSSANNKAQCEANRKRVHDDTCDCRTCVSGVKRCSRCGDTKCRNEFGANRSSADGLHSYCQSCSRRHVRKSRYALEEGVYQRMLVDQCHRCGACGNPFGSETPVVDHDHACCPTEKTCGKCIRMLLCGNCNKALGLIKDDPQRAISLATYLMRFQDVLHFST